MAPKCVGAATLRDAGNGPLDFDHAGERIDDFNNTIGEWVPLGKVAAAIVQRQAYHLSRRTGITPALALALAPLVYGEARHER